MNGLLKSFLSDACPHNPGAVLVDGHQLQICWESPSLSCAGFQRSLDA
jgi:hypothetical protein